MQIIYTMYTIPLFDSFKQLYYTVITVCVCVCVCSCMHLYCIAHGPEAFNANKYIIIIIIIINVVHDSRIVDAVTNDSDMLDTISS